MPYVGPILGGSMKRREFISLLGSAAVSACSPEARAQKGVRRIGVLLPFDNETDPQVRQLWPAFIQRLHDLGWIEGRNIQFDLHFTGQDKARINSGAAQLAAGAPDLIVVWSNPAAAALK